MKARFKTISLEYPEIIRSENFSKKIFQVQLRYLISTLTLCDFQRTFTQNIGAQHLLSLYHFIYVHDQRCLFHDKAQNEQNLLIEGPNRNRKSFSRVLLVEVNGFEPMTSCVQGRRSPN